MVFPSYPAIARKSVQKPSKSRTVPIIIAVALALALLAASLLFERCELSRRSEELAGAAAWNSFALELGALEARRP